MRLRAIFCCLYFGLVPWSIYEKTKHYCGTYWGHLKLNLEQSTVWLLYKETEEDIAFEKEVNASWSSVLKNLLGGLL